MPGIRRRAKPPCSEARDKHVAWLSGVCVCVIAIWEYWKASKKKIVLAGSECLTGTK